MPRIEYEGWAPRGEALWMVQQADEICRDYAAQGYNLTLRQLYYQFVSKALIPNSDKSYKKLGNVINKARLAGLLDWDYLEDRTRSIAGNSHWDNPGQILRGVAGGYRVDTWEDQPTRIEVWVEKEALAGVMEPVCRRFDIDWFSCRGYVSQSEMWAAGQRLGGYIAGGQRVLILHLGDHDPSGIDMTRDITDRLGMFIATDDRSWPFNVGYDDINNDDDRRAEIDAHLGDMGIEMTRRRFDDPERWGEDPDEVDDVLEIRRIALTMDQIRQYQPPPNPAKITDSRAMDYIAKYGRESWELDALSPAVLDALVTSHIQDEIDTARMAARQLLQEEQRALLSTLSERWREVQGMLND